MSLMRLYSLTASDLEDWASSGEEPGTHLPNELTQAGTDSKLICILTKAQSGLRMVSSGTACPQLLRQMIPAGQSSKQPPTRNRCCFFQEVHNELTKVWLASSLLILPPSPLLMALKKKGYGKLSIWRRMSWMPYYACTRRGLGQLGGAWVWRRSRMPSATPVSRLCGFAIDVFGKKIRNWAPTALIRLILALDPEPRSRLDLYAERKKEEGQVPPRPDRPKRSYVTLRFPV